MAEKGKNGNRDYKKEYAEYHAKPEQKKNRAARNAARAEVEKKTGKLPSNVDVDHKKMIKDGGGNDPSNLRVVPESQNAGWRKGRKGYK